MSDRQQVDALTDCINLAARNGASSVTLEQADAALAGLRAALTQQHSGDDQQETEAEVRAVERIAEELVGREQLFNEEGEMLEHHWPMVQDLAWSLFRAAGNPQPDDQQVELGKRLLGAEAKQAAIESLHHRLGLRFSEASVSAILEAAWNEATGHSFSLPDDPAQPDCKEQS